MTQAGISIGAFENSFARLPDGFFQRLNPTPVSQPVLLAFNRELAEELGLQTAGISEQDLANVFSGRGRAAGFCLCRASIR